MTSAAITGNTGRGGFLGLRGWVLATGAAVLLHAGAAAAVLTSLDAQDADPSFGAPAIEIGIELASPVVDPSDLPPGQVADDSAASVAMQEQRARVEQTELENAVPTETEDPDRVVAPDATEKPKEDEPTKSTVNTNASSESVASEAAAPPSIENAPPAEQSVAPAQGTGESARLIRAGWQKELVAHINRFKRYPPGAPSKSVEIVLRFTLDRLGRVGEATIVKGSGDAAFDGAALAMMKRADPVPQPPARVADEGLTFTLPVLFRAKGRG